MPLKALNWSEWSPLTCKKKRWLTLICQWFKVRWRCDHIQNVLTSSKRFVHILHECDQNRVSQNVTKIIWAHGEFCKFLAVTQTYCRQYVRLVSMAYYLLANSFACLCLMYTAWKKKEKKPLACLFQFLLLPVFLPSLSFQQSHAHVSTFLLEIPKFNGLFAIIRNIMIPLSLFKKSKTHCPYCCATEKENNKTWSFGPKWHI